MFVFVFVFMYMRVCVCVGNISHAALAGQAKHLTVECRLLLLLLSLCLLLLVLPVPLPLSLLSRCYWGSLPLVVLSFQLLAAWRVVCTRIAGPELQLGCLARVWGGHSGDVDVDCNRWFQFIFI